MSALEDLRQDLQYGARMLAKSPGFTSVAILWSGAFISRWKFLTNAPMLAVYPIFPKYEPLRAGGLWSTSCSFCNVPT